MVLICISLMISGVEYLFMPVGYLHFLFGKMSIQVFYPFFLSDCFYFLMLSCMSSFQRSFNREQNDKLKKYVHNSRFSGKRKKLVSKTSFLLGKEAKEEKGCLLCASQIILHSWLPVLCLLRSHDQSTLSHYCLALYLDKAKIIFIF